MQIALNLSNRNITLVTAEGHTVQKWKTVLLPSDAVKDGLILQPELVAGPLNSLFNSLEVPRHNVIASITGISFTYRVLKLPRLKYNRLQEAVERATQKEINLPIEELYLDWQIIENRSDEIDVFVAGVPRRPVESLLTTMEMAKVRLTAIDLKSLALARAAGQANALIVDCEADCFDIVIISGGIPVNLHSVAPRSKTASLEDTVSDLVGELTRTIDFYNLNRNGNLMLPDTPIFLAGSLAAEPAVFNSIPTMTGHPVKLLTTSFKVPADFPVSAYASNLGLLLKKPDLKTKIKYDIHNYNDINLNPLTGRKRALARPVQVRKILLPIAIIIAILLIVPVSLLRNQALAKTTGLQADLDRVNRSLLLGRLAMNEANTTQTAINELTVKTQAFQKERELISGKGELSEILRFIFFSLPTGAHNTAISSDAKQIIIDGTASNRAEIIDYARNLARGDKFTEVRIASIESSKNGETGNSGTDIPYQIVIER